MIKQFAIMGAVAFGSYALIQKINNRPVLGGFSVMDTKGKEYQLNESKDGFLYDQFGGMWT